MSGPPLMVTVTSSELAHPPNALFVTVSVYVWLEVRLTVLVVAVP